MSQLCDFYRDKTIFITGVTGFIGKVFLEKLLRKCPDVAMVYCLVRSKDGEDVSLRLDNLLNHQCFENLWREVFPLVRGKVRVVEGDILKEELGIEAEMKKVLQSSVQVVVHLAGTVKFDCSLRQSLQMNVLAVRHLVHVCSGMHLLQSLVHMSTAYANCEQSFISEQVYPSAVDPAKILELLEWLDEDSFNSISTKLLDEKPNTFVFSKHLAEVLLMTEGCHLPISIMRPSIVTAAWLEPMPGWVDSENGPSSLYIAMGKGLLRSMIAEQCVVADIVPVDLAVNMTLVVLWFRATHLRDDHLVSSSSYKDRQKDMHYPVLSAAVGADGEDYGGGGVDGGADDGERCSGRGDEEHVMSGEAVMQKQGNGEVANCEHDDLPATHCSQPLSHSYMTAMTSSCLLDHNKHHNNNNSVYHLTTGGVNPFTWGEMEDSVMTYFQKNPLDKCFRRPKSHVITSNSFLHDCWILLSHMVPAYAADLGYVLIGSKPRMVKTYSRLHRTLEEMEYLTTRSWHWTHSHMDLLRGHMSAEDQKAFNFDPRTLHWSTYIENSCYGTRKFLLKEAPSDLPHARSRLKLLRNIRYAFNTAVLVLLWRVLVARSHLASNSWSLLLKLVYKFVSFFKLTSSLQK